MVRPAKSWIRGIRNGECYRYNHSRVSQKEHEMVKGGKDKEPCPLAATICLVLLSWQITLIDPSAALFLAF